MTAIKRQGVIARPGIFHYSWGDETKSREDLIESLNYTPTIKLTLGHPEGGRTRRSDFLGYVKPSWDEKSQAVIGDFWFYEEHVNKLPENIRQKILNGEPWKISAAFTMDETKDGSQKGTFFDHIAILREDDNAVCPLEKCGVNVTAVRQESEAVKMYYEQAQETGTNTTAPTPLTTEKPKSGASPEMDALRAKAAVLETIIALKKQMETPLSVPKPEIAVKAEAVKVEPKASTIGTSTTNTTTPPAEKSDPKESLELVELRREVTKLKAELASAKTPQTTVPQAVREPVAEEKKQVTSPPPEPAVIIPAGVARKSVLNIDERTGWLIVENTGKKE